MEFPRVVCDLCVRVDIRIWVDRTGVTHFNWAFQILTILDEYTRECSSITVGRRITAQDVIYQLGELFLERGISEHIRSDNGPEFTARVIRQWLRGSCSQDSAC
jgi:transposase InsO family protein